MDFDFMAVSSKAIEARLRARPLESLSAPN